LNLAPGALGILTAGERRLTVEPQGGDRRLSWAVAVMTAPRRPPTLAAMLASLRAAGFDVVHVFAEPGASIPAGWPDVPVTQNPRRLGHLRNFVTAAESLLNRHPESDCYAVFEDDIAAARGLRQWCDGQFWPGGHGVVSLYTCRVFADDRPGWQTLNLGRYRTFGSLAFVFRGEELRAFLADPGVVRHIDRGHPSADAVLGEWALKRGIGIAYHTPSLVQHEGFVSSTTRPASGCSVRAARTHRAVAVAAVEEVDCWRSPPPRPGVIGLVGANSPTGLGYQNRDLAAHLPVARWLAHADRWGWLPRPTIPGKYRAPWGTRWRVAPSISPRTQRAWLSGLDWIVFVEKPGVPGIVGFARAAGISVACVPNWEWLSPALDWLPYVDLMICPTAVTERMLRRWRRERGFSWDVAHVPWPIDPARFAFRRRDRCRRFLFVNGTGGTRGGRTDGTRTPYRRKGLALVAETARLLPDVPFLVYSQVADLPPLPGNVDVRPAPADNADLYRDGDVCVQPSHWEGLGLQLLECQAAGMPLVTTDAPPMNECRPFRAVPAAATETVFLNGDEPIESQLVRPEDLAAVLAAIYDTDIRDASEGARAYVERERSWPRARAAIAALLPA
jgi:hypothetical protein